ncbi:MAG: HAD-IA family hydrolase [Methylobacter sp.]|jgi:FMN phosphatase YigB (HAD superfamily)
MKHQPVMSITACVFDAYGTLFDFTSAAAQEQRVLGDKWQALSDLWRTKQLQYTWLRSLMEKHADFWQVITDRFSVKADQICFVSSNAWDAHAAKAFGFRVVWCNRFGQTPERIPLPPDGEITTLASLPAIVGMT